MSNRYRAYDAFARLYDRHWGPSVARHIEILDEHVLDHVSVGADVLDLCCGTGQLAAILCDRGYRVTGLDGSEAMIEYARRNAPGARFLVADARSFHIEHEFNLVLSLYDSLNHIMTAEDLATVFHRVAMTLGDDGLFAFDLNMEPKYLHTWAGEFSVIEEAEVGIVRAGVDPADRVAYFDVTLFYEEDDQRWSRHGVRLEQTWYGAEIIARMLIANGFEPPQMHAKQTMPDDPGTAQNLLFVTRRT